MTKLNIFKFIKSNLMTNEKFQLVLDEFDRNISILEVVCGYGRNSVMLKKMGFVRLLVSDGRPIMSLDEEE